MTYTWMLKNKTTGKIYPKFTYKTRESARKAVRSASGRFANFTPVKVFSKPSRTKSTGKFKTAKSSMVTKRPNAGYDISQSYDISKAWYMAQR